MIPDLCEVQLLASWHNDKKLDNMRTQNDTWKYIELKFPLGGFMKRIVLVVAMVMVVAGNAWADCKAYECAEIKDMSDATLKAEFDKVDTSYAPMKKKMAIQLGLKNYDDSIFKDARECHDQFTKLNKEMKKRLDRETKKREREEELSAE